MPVSAQRRLKFTDRKIYGKSRSEIEAPPLTEIQTKSYERFLQFGIDPAKRENFGLESVLRETF
ncbi:MAG: hypothetical protein ACRDD1_12310, partial [Planctomycetia bacterium]